MLTLIVSSSASSAGALRSAGIVQRVEFVEPRLICGPLPTSFETRAYFAPYQDADGDIRHWQRDFDAPAAQASGGSRPGLIEICRGFDVIELWVDPDPNAQLVFIELLNFLHSDNEILGKIFFRQLDRRAGELSPSDIAAWTPQVEKIEARHLMTAAAAWDAFQSPTPEAWFALLATDLSGLPRLRSCTLELLNELPAIQTALGATEQAILRLIEPGKIGPFSVFPGKGIPPVFDYWEVGRALDQLSHCPTPAVLGLDEGPFTLALHEDRDRYEIYKRSQLSLSDLGRALLDGKADFSRHNPINRWWGNTKLTNDRLWRWNLTDQTLVSPS